MRRSCAFDITGVKSGVEHDLANAVGWVGFGDAFEEHVCLAQAREPRGTLVTVSDMGE
jgi:hypothetical protein